jgi:hypothetical protein
MYLEVDLVTYWYFAGQKPSQGSRKTVKVKRIVRASIRNVNIGRLIHQVRQNEH